jgi:hypothetical protein
MSDNLQAKLDAAILALRTIHAGSSQTGRWLADGEALDGSRESGPPDGYYDEDQPPDGYDAGGWCRGEACKPEESLRPCAWEYHTKEEQDDWLESIAWMSRRALEEIGVPLVAPVGEG